MISQKKIYRNQFVKLDDLDMIDLSKIVYGFEGWYASRDIGDELDDLYRAVNEAAANTDSWNDVDDYITLTYNGNGGTNTEGACDYTVYVKNNAGPIDFLDYAPHGAMMFDIPNYVLEGWATDPDDRSTIGQPVDIQSGCVTVFAIWKPVQDKVSDTPNIDPIYSGIAYITGEGTPGSLIKAFFDGGESVYGIVDQNGNWSLLTPGSAPLDEGKSVSVQQTEPHRVPSGMACKTACCGGDVNHCGGSGMNDTPDVNPVYAGANRITGRGTPGSVINIKFPDESVCHAVVGANGDWPVKVPGGVTLSEGDAIFAMQISDSAPPSNWVKKCIQSRTEQQSGDTPGINPLRENDTAVSGRGMPGATIFVEWPGGAVSETVARDSGDWLVGVPGGIDLDAGRVVSVAQREDGQMIGVPAQSTVGGDACGGLKSDTPDIGAVCAKAAEITGCGTPGAIVVVKFKHGVTGNTVVGAGADWSLCFPAGIEPVENDTLYAQQHTPGKNPSDWAQRTVR